MDETYHLLRFIDEELDTRKEQLARGMYKSQETYFQVLGECKTLFMLRGEAQRLIDKRVEIDDDDE